MTQPGRRMFWLLARAQRRVNATSDAGLADLGLTATQAGALFCFTDEGLLVGDLAAKLDLAQSAASGLARRLEDAGLVVRSEDAADGRAARLKLTALGKRRREVAGLRVATANARLLEGFSEREIDTVVRWLNRVAEIPEENLRPKRQKERT
ncbi:MAG: MarR family transcriptional regulator [Hyphomonadaceae bacterium]|nr:MarR family transcriptional regulator [Hyphomonadaceae bacterium]